MVKRLLLALSLLVLVPAGGLAALAEEPSADLAAAQRIITDQLAAFARDDGAAAYAFAAPSIQLKFPNPEIFMRMVRQGYAPVYRPQSYGFATSEVMANGVIRQDVDVITSDGEAWTAQYLLQRQSDGSLKIIACSLLRKPGVGA